MVDTRLMMRDLRSDRAFGGAVETRLSNEQDSMPALILTRRQRGKLPLAIGSPTSNVVQHRSNCCREIFRAVEPRPNTVEQIVSRRAEASETCISKVLLDVVLGDQASPPSIGRVQCINCLPKRKSVIH